MRWYRDFIALCRQAEGVFYVLCTVPDIKKMERKLEKWEFMKNCRLAA